MHRFLCSFPGLAATIINLLLVLGAFGLSGCDFVGTGTAPCYGDNEYQTCGESDDDSTADDDDTGSDDDDTGDDDTVSDDDDTGDDDTSSDDDSVADWHAFCDGIDRNVDFDCDGRLDNGNDWISPDPYEPRVFFADSVVSWSGDVAGAGLGYNQLDNDWLYNSANEATELSSGDWVLDLDPDADGDGDGCTLYRINLRGHSGAQWGNLRCENSATRDASCLYDAGCPNNTPPIPPGYASGLNVCEWGSRAATSSERVMIPLAQDSCD